MAPETVAAIGLLILAAAFLYSSVGHAGASGYIAVMALFGVAPAVMKPTALVLNLIVATIGTIQFARAGHFSWRLTLPFVFGSAPFAYLGGLQDPNAVYYKPLVGLVLLFTAYRSLAAPLPGEHAEIRPPRWWAAVPIGMGLGLLAGLTGTGGGIFLSPLILFMGWAGVKPTAGASVVFILVNSAAGFLGQQSYRPELPAEVPIWALAALLGGLVGSYLGARRFGTKALRWLLGVVLLVAGLKLVFSG
jgi:uncharacterized membrane protein YfcA